MPASVESGVVDAMQEPLWYDEVLTAELRSGEASSFADTTHFIVMPLWRAIRKERKEYTFSVN